MNQGYGAFGAKVPEYQIMGAANTASGPGGTGLSDAGRAYMDAGAGGFFQSAGYDIPRFGPMPPRGGPGGPRVPPLVETQPTDLPPIFDYPPAGGGGEGGTRLPAGLLPARLAPRFRNEVNVYVQGGTVTPTSPAPAAPAVVADVGTSTPLEVYDDASASTDEKPLQYVWAVGYVPAWQAAELNADPVKLEKAQAVVKHGRKRKLLMGAGAIILGFLIARAARKAA